MRRRRAVPLLLAPVLAALAWLALEAAAFAPSGALQPRQPPLCHQQRSATSSSRGARRRHASLPITTAAATAAATAADGSHGGGEDHHHHPEHHHAAAAAPPPPPVHLQPRHLAIIPDGNGRWAQRRGLPRAVGHQEGAKRALEVLEACQELGGIKLVTLYCLSTENTARRPPGEVAVILRCIEASLRANLAYAHDHRIRLAVVGQRERLPASLQQLIARAESETKGYDGLTVCLALSYGGRADIVQAARRLAAEAATGALRPEEIDEAVFARHLQTGPLLAGFDDPDLIVRTSGERRLSNFMLWESAYAELYHTEAMWPEFGKEALHAAVWDYARRRRRYGGLEDGKDEDEGGRSDAAAVWPGARPAVESPPG